MSIEFLKPSGLFNPGGYTPAVHVKDGSLLVISGQVAWDTEGKTVGTTLEAQMAKVFENLKTVLASAGADFSHVVKLSIFVVNLQPERDLATIREVRNRYINLENPPASTLLGVQSLASPDLLVEVEALAVIPA